MLTKAASSMSALFVRDLTVSLRSRRLAAASIVLGVALLVGGWIFGQAALASPENGTGAPLWQRGADGALVALSFAILPLALPLVPVALVTRNLQRDLSHGDFELVMSRPNSAAGTALGKSAGMFVAIAIPLVPLSVASALLIQLVAGTPVDGGLVVGFVGSNLVLAALYLLLALVVGTLLGPRDLLAVALLAWFGFNLLSPVAFVLLGQFIGFLPVQDPNLFRLTWTDAASFTGIYQGLIAAYVPAGLGIVMQPDAPSAGSLLLQWAPFAWTLALLTLYSLLLRRIPNR
ncbi:MAG: hypothetical protein V3U33_00610 [candidate division NC10 bacterium]